MHRRMHVVPIARMICLSLFMTKASSSAESLYFFSLLPSADAWFAGAEACGVLESEFYI